MTSLTAQEIFDYEDLPLTEVKVDFWGGASVYVRSLNGVERDQYEAKMIMAQNDPSIESKLESIRMYLVFLCTCDENGKRLFNTDEDYKRLKEKNWQALEPIAEMAQKLNALSDDDVDELAKK